jgi:IclR family transcriptional regulator, pca regulon regulatory protein
MFTYMNSEVKSAARVLEVIELLAEAARPLALKEIVAELAFPKSSAHALAQTLVSRGYVVQDATERYALEESCRQGFAGRAREARLISISRPIMEALRDRSGETVMLCVRTPRGEVKRLAKCVSQQAVRYDIDLAAPTAVYCTATGRVLLAFSGADAIDAYFAHAALTTRTPHTVTDPARLREILADVRRDGVAMSDQEFVFGSTGIAAPLRNREGTVIAALNLGTVTARFELNKASLISGVKQAAARLSRRLGWAASPKVPRADDADAADAGSAS